MSRSRSNRSIAPIRPSSPYETRSPSSTCAGRPDPRRPATYLTSGEYMTISRSRTALSCVRLYSSQMLRVSTCSATEREYELAPHSPQRCEGHRAHPGGDCGRCQGDHPAPNAARDRRGDRDSGEGERQDAEECDERHAAIMPQQPGLNWLSTEGRSSVGRAA